MEPGTSQTWKFVKYICIKTEASQRINAVDRSRGILEVFIYLFTVFIFNSKALFVCVKDRVCLKVAIPAYCFTIFGSIFGVLFCLLIKKLILGSKTIWQSMRKFPCAVWSAKIFPNMDKDENCFLETGNLYDLILFR